MTLESVQRRATRWILKTNVGEMPYEDRLTTLNQLPLVYDRELIDLVLVYKSIYGCIDLNIEQFVSFVNKVVLAPCLILNLRTVKHQLFSLLLQPSS